jgi:hypothetical protein
VERRVLKDGPKHNSIFYYDLTVEKWAKGVSMREGGRKVWLMFPELPTRMLVVDSDIAGLRPSPNIIELMDVKL